MFIHYKYKPIFIIIDNLQNYFVYFSFLSRQEHFTTFTNFVDASMLRECIDYNYCIVQHDIRSAKFFDTDYSSNSIADSIMIRFVVVDIFALQPDFSIIIIVELVFHIRYCQLL